MGAPSPHHLRREGRVFGELEDSTPAACTRDDPDRSLGGDAAQAALDAASGLLERQELFGIYPEGTRSRDGKLHKGHTGPARLALRNRCPIVPVGIVGTDEIQPPGARFPRMFRYASIRVGPALDVGRYGERPDDRLALRQITDEVMYEIRELTGQEYVDSYATREPEAMPRPTTGIIGGQRTPSDPGGNGDGRASSGQVVDRVREAGQRP